MRNILSVPALLLLGACATVPATPVAADPVAADPVSAEPAEICRRDALASFTGQPATAELGARMLRESGARTLRWVAKGMMVTMDYRGDRLTVRLDANNRVERASCG